MNAHLRRLVPAVLKQKAAASYLLLAGLLVSGSPAWAILHTTCVNNAADLQSELAKAGQSGANNDGDNHINLAVGAYVTGYLQYRSTKTFTLDITGGYNSDCSKQITRNPIYTVLIGDGSTNGILETNSMGDVSIRYLTFKGGNADIGAGGVDMNGGGSTGQVILDYNIFAQNIGAFAVGVGYSTLVQLDGNLFYGNYSNQATFYTTQIDKFFALNNTFAQNTLNSIYTGALIVNLTDTASPADLSNNIFFDTLDKQIAFGSKGTAQMSHNILPDNTVDTYTTQGATVTENDLLFPDIQFLGATDFRLQGTSPGIAAGTLTPPGYNQPGGSLPTLDLQGNPRTYNGTVDVGAYEKGDDIFKDGLGF